MGRIKLLELAMALEQRHIPGSAEHKSYEEIRARWSQKLQPQVDAIRASECLSREDYATMFNTPPIFPRYKPGMTDEEINHLVDQHVANMVAHSGLPPTSIEAVRRDHLRGISRSLGRDIPRVLPVQDSLPFGESGGVQVESTVSPMETEPVN